LGRPWLPRGETVQSQISSVVIGPAQIDRGCRSRDLELWAERSRCAQRGPPRRGRARSDQLPLGHGAGGRQLRRCQWLHRDARFGSAADAAKHPQLLPVMGLDMGDLHVQLAAPAGGTLLVVAHGIFASTVRSGGFDRDQFGCAVATDRTLRWVQTGPPGLNGALRPLLVVFRGPFLPGASSGLRHAQL
jgi:hypothetical protein